MRQTNKENVTVYNYLAKIFTRQIPKNKSYLYKLSIAIANKLCMPPLHGLMYPTVAMSGNADNIALLPSFVDHSLEFVAVEYIEVTRDGEKGSYKILDSATEISEDEKIQWTAKFLVWGGKLNEVNVASGGDHWVVRDQRGKQIKPTGKGEMNPGNTLLEKE